jgi:hypothetical protein
VSTALPASPSKSRRTRRVPVLAAASALVAAASVTVTLAVATGGSDTSSPAPAGTPALAQPDRAKLFGTDWTLPGRARSTPRARLSAFITAERLIIGVRGTPT